MAGTGRVSASCGGRLFFAIVPVEMGEAKRKFRRIFDFNGVLERGDGLAYVKREGQCWKHISLSKESSPIVAAGLPSPCRWNRRPTTSYQSASGRIWSIAVLA